MAKRFRARHCLAIGIIAYGLRMFLFAYVNQIVAATHIGPVPILIAGIAMHGLSFGCFIFVAFMVVDEQTTGDVRASAQSLFNLVIIGVGVIVGSEIAGWVARMGHDRQRPSRLHEAIQRADVGVGGVPRGVADLLPEPQPKACAVSGVAKKRPSAAMR